jgi:long-chain fatty acid transport protein
MNRSRLMAGVAVAVFAMSGSAYATDGYFQTGYGQQVVAMGGASDGVVTGAMGGADNPAGISFAGESFSLGGTFFVPHRGASRTGNLYGLNGATTSKDDNFLLPDIGFNAPINDQLSFGITIYGNGGLNTDYPDGTLACPNPKTGQLGPGNILCGSGHLGVNLEQLIIAPSLSYKITPNFAVAVSPQIVYQMFSAEGLQPFQPLSIHPNSVTDRGGDGSLGIGVKVGVFWQVTPQLSLGATYSPQADMERFKKYAGLFAGDGEFNVPANFSVGFGYHVTPQFLVAADFQRIFYANVPAIGDQSNVQAPLGSANGPGFGWRNINVYKVGVKYEVTPAVTLMGGYTDSQNPVTAQNVTFNILAPGVVENQASAGLTYALTPQNDLTVTYSHAFTNTVSGPTSPLLPGGGTDKIYLGENSIGVGFLHKFNAPAPVAAPPPEPTPVAAPAPAPARTYLVFFNWNKADLTPRATQIVAEAAQASRITHVTSLNVNGYTDTSGSPAYNMKLSYRRADNVAAQLVSDGVPKSDIVIKGFGETHLLVPTGPGVREPQNRRVEIILH